MKVLFTLPFLTIDHIITLDSKVVYIWLSKTIAKLIGELHRRLGRLEPEMRKEYEEPVLFRTFMLNLDNKF